MPDSPILEKHRGDWHLQNEEVSLGESSSGIDIFSPTNSLEPQNENAEDAPRWDDFEDAPQGAVRRNKWGDIIEDD